MISRARGNTGKFVSGIIPQHLFFPLFLPFPVLKKTRISGNFKANNGYFLANFR